MPTSKRDTCACRSSIASTSACEWAPHKLLIDPNTGTILNSPGAMKLFKRQYREPWVIPEAVRG